MLLDVDTKQRYFSPIIGCKFISLTEWNICCKNLWWPSSFIICMAVPKTIIDIIYSLNQK